MSEFIYRLQFIGRLDKSEMNEFSGLVNKLGYSAEFCICTESTILEIRLIPPGCRPVNCFWFLWDNIDNKHELTA